MAALVVLDIVALVADLVIGIIQILPLLDTHNVPEGSTSIVRVGIGLYNTSSLGGDVPGITVWNEDGKKLGNVPTHKGTKVEAGAYVDIVVPQNPAKLQPTYVKIEGGNDSVCVAYIGHAWPDGTRRGWLGDIGKVCGREWFYSNTYVTQPNGTQYKPFCTWIGGIGATPGWTTEMTIHTPEFSSIGQSNDFSVPPDPSSLCRSSASTWGNKPIASSGSIRTASLFGIFTLFSMLTNAIPTGQKSISTSASPFQSTIVGSHYARHNSTALCSSPLSYGPDFVSFHEGVFCDMTKKHTIPLCKFAQQYDCYDWNTHSLVDRKLKKRKMGYSEVIEWK
ncbi:hypothetical protein BGZ60DRAFT_144656 [Tricladium varicosporioides]|nr:hypothetical protein BGZ60DRAFT_144656 [Hymenoscyphus varicosporioides]